MSLTAKQADRHDGAFIPRPSEQATDRDAKIGGALESFYALKKCPEEKAEGRRRDKTRREKQRAFSLATCAQCQSFSGSIVLTSLQRGHSEESGRTQKGKRKRTNEHALSSKVMVLRS
ncbi:unnamed protein product [Pleuronectes platessa]|uniref:Uncharacterized protein n=1 Tax=Pleuronectes platessa TaxID=8262 RepID=A0A9N7ZB38_PLEPL|nr:unnamed protein product [Pleuronectes platessa]